MYFINKDICVDLTSSDSVAVQACIVPELCSSQARRGWLILGWCYSAFMVAQQDYDRDIVVRSPAIDILILLLYFTKWFYLHFDTGSGNNRRLS